MTWISSPSGESDLADDLDADARLAGAHETQLPCRTLRKVDDPALDEGATVIDTHDNASAIVPVGDLYLGTETKRTVCRSHLRRVHHFAGRSARAQCIPGCPAAVGSSKGLAGNLNSRADEQGTSEEERRCRNGTGFQYDFHFGSSA